MTLGLIIPDWKMYLCHQKLIKSGLLFLSFAFAKSASTGIQFATHCFVLDANWKDWQFSEDDGNWNACKWAESLFWQKFIVCASKCFESFYNSEYSIPLLVTHSMWSGFRLLSIKTIRFITVLGTFNVNQTSLTFK